MMKSNNILTIHISYDACNSNEIINIVNLFAILKVVIHQLLKLLYDLSMYKNNLSFIMQ